MFLKSNFIHRHLHCSKTPKLKLHFLKSVYEFSHLLIIVIFPLKKLFYLQLILFQDENFLI